MKATMLGVAVILVLAALALPLVRRLRPEADLRGASARVKAWWTMALIFVAVNRINGALSLLGFLFLSGMALREYLQRIEDLPRSVRWWAYAAVPAQYWWVYWRWYGMFIVFIPVYMFLYTPVRLSVRQAALVQWGLMATVFCASHAAFLLVVPGPVAGPALMLFVVLLTETGEAVRLLAPRLAPLALGASAAAGALLGPLLTPLPVGPAAATGLVLGWAGHLGGQRLLDLREALGLAEGPLKPGQGGALARLIALTYTAPLFLHGYRYFYGW